MQLFLLFQMWGHCFCLWMNGELSHHHTSYVTVPPLLRCCTVKSESLLPEKRRSLFFSVCESSVHLRLCRPTVFSSQPDLTVSSSLSTVLIFESQGVSEIKD